MKVVSCGHVIRGKRASERALSLHFYWDALRQNSLLSSDSEYNGFLTCAVIAGPSQIAAS
jgi:hypothetical protein